MKLSKVVPESDDAAPLQNKTTSSWSSMVQTVNILRCFGAHQRAPLKPILKSANRTTNSWSYEQKIGVRFKDECKTEHPFLSTFAHGKRLMRAWGNLIFLALSYEVWAFPFRLAFNDPSVSSIIFALDVASDSIFFTDIIMELFESLDTELKQNEDPSIENQLIINTISRYITLEISRNFFCIVTYYTATVLTSSAISPFNGVIDLDVTYYHWLWWLSTVPRMLVRGYRLYKSFSTASTDLGDSIHVEDGKNIAMLIILSAHCIGCIYFFMSRLRGLDRRTWVSNIEDTLNVYSRFEGNLWEHYLLALFKGFSSISGIEFTTYLPNNLEEMILGIIMILIQVYISALILGTIIHFLAIRDPLAEQAAQRVKDLRQYISTYQIPSELESKLLKGLEFQHRKMMIDNIDADLELSQSLQSKVVQSKYSGLLQKGKNKGQIFSGCNDRFLHEMLIEFNVMYLMAAQEIFKKGDISREMLVLIDGSAEVLNESGEVIAIVSSDSPDLFPCVGEVAFFLGIMQPYTVRANKTADVRVVALSREDSKVLFKKFPDQLELISQNILRAHGLAVDGSYESDAVNAEEDASRAATRDELHATIVRRREESFAALIMAVKASELDDVERLWLGGMEAIKDYDGRTLLAYAAVAGAYKVVEFLIEVKSDVNERNRWGQTPLDEAMTAKQQSTVQLLFQHGGRMGADAISTTLIEAASLGTLEKSYNSEQLFRIMRQSHVDPDIGDYDGRTALHLACANGYIKTADLLINLKANVTINDRWLGTPLEDAVACNHIAVATFLRSKGATMQTASGTSKFCDAAAKGNVVALQMLHGCDVVDLECSDYDERNALHIAASEGRLLAVAYLLSKSISPQLVDRWGGTALDNSLVSSTPYHRYCSKLIMSMGGEVALLKDTEECTRAMADVDTVKIGDVRKLLRRLDRAGYNHIVPKPVVESELRLSLECCFAHLPLVETMRSTCDQHTTECNATVDAMSRFAAELKEGAMPICELLDTHPFLRLRKKPVIVSDAQDYGAADAGDRPLTLLRDEFAALDNVQGTARFDCYSGSRRYLISKLSKIIKDALEDGNIDDDEQAQIDLAWNELTMTGEELSLQGIDALDSDDEAELYADVDNILTEREFCDEHRFERTLYKVSKFRTAALRISDMEAMYNKLCTLFWLCKERCPEPVPDVEPPIRFHDMIVFFNMVGETTLQHTPSFEIEGMFDAAVEFKQRDRLFRRDHSLTDRIRRRSIDAELAAGASDSSSDFVSLRHLVAGSEDFRSAILTLSIDENFGLIVCRTKLRDLVPEPVLRQLCRGASLRNAGKGEVVLDHDGRRGSDTTAEADKGTSDKGAEAPKMWSVVVSGSVSLSFKAANEGDAESDCKFLGNSNVFGGYVLLEGARCPPFTIKSTAACQLVQFPAESLVDLLAGNPLVGERLLAEMAEGSSSERHDRQWGSALPAEPKKFSSGSFANFSKSFIAGFAKNGSDYLDNNPSASPRPAATRSNGMTSPLPEAFVSVAGLGLTPQAETHKADLERTLRSAVMAFKTPRRSSSGGTFENDVGFGSNKFVLQPPPPPPSPPPPPPPSATSGYNSTSDLFAIRSGFKCILEVWQSLSEGEPAISQYVLHSVQENLGEVASGVFVKLFLPPESSALYDCMQDLDMFHNVEASEFWASWMQLLADRKSYDGGEPAPQTKMRELGTNADSAAVEASGGDSNEAEGPHKESGLWEALHARFSPARRLRDKFLNKQLMESGVYEDVFAKVTGSLNVPLQHRDVGFFIKGLFPRYPYRISIVNCKEFIDLFGRNGMQRGEITWADIRKVLRPSLNTEKEGFFIDTVLHPNSKLMRWFWSFVKILAAYHFVSVPLQLCFFEDTTSMYEIHSMELFLPVDILTFLYLVIRLNTGYKSVRRNVWVTNRWKIAGKVGALAMVPALPFDWIVFALGASYEACLWIRMSKLLLPYQVVARSTSWTTQISRWGRFKYQVMASCAVIHIFTCFWFFISKKYQYWDPEHPFSWFKYNYPPDDPRYVKNEPIHMNEYQYAGLSCEETKTAACDPDDKWYYYGMGVEDGMMDRYMLSLYMACTRIANQPLIGLIVPENFVEVCYSIAFMILNLTVFRYVIGDLSTSVIESDEGRVSARTRAMKIFLFISRNNFSPDLAEEIKTYCDNSSTSAGALSKSSKILRGLPHSLQVEVASHVCRDQLDNVSILAGCSENFKNLVSLTVTTRAFTSEEYLFRRGEVSSDMFIVQNGCVEELIEAENTITGERVESVSGAGKVLGEVAFFFELRHVVSARAARGGGAACLQIGRENFLQLLKYYPEDEEIVTENAIKAVAITKQGTSVVSFLSEGNVASLGGASERSANSDGSHGRHGAGRTNLDNILHIQRNHKMMRKLLLFSAAKGNDLARIQWCLKGNSLNINECDQFGRSILHVAACEGHVKLVDYLLKASANVTLRDHRGNTPLNDAVLQRHDDIATLIRQQVPGIRLSFEGFIDGVQMCEAATAGNLQQIVRLVDNGVAVNAHDYDKRTALHLASCEGKLDVVKYLIMAQANLSFQDRFGNTALDDAIRHAHRGVQQALFAAGARVGGMNNVLKACAASAVADSDAIDLIKNLVAMGLDPREGDYDQRTPLHLAACSGKLGILEFFMSIGAKAGGRGGELFNVCDRYGYTPLDDAHRHGHAPAVVLLERGGALRRGDPALTTSLAAQRASADADRRLKLRTEAARRMQSSPESEAWASVDGAVLPSLRDFFRKLVDTQQAMADLAALVLPAVRGILQRYIREVLPHEMSIIEAKSFHRRKKPAAPSATPGGGRGGGDSLALHRPDPKLVVRSRKGRGQQVVSDGVTLEAAIDEVLKRIGDFLRTDCAAAKEILRVDFSRCQALRLASMPLSQALKALSLQIRHNAGALKIIRKVLKEVKSVCLSFQDDRPSASVWPVSVPSVAEEVADAVAGGSLAEEEEEQLASHEGA